MTPSYETLDVSCKDGVFVIRMNRPQKKNAMDDKMMLEIPKALKWAEMQDNISIAVLTGVGEYYSSGYDLTELGVVDDIDDAIESRVQIGRNLVSAFIDFSKILIAVVNGHAVGIAVTSLGLCDIVYASEVATFRTPFVKFGFCAEGCSSYLFPRIMGISRAGSMLYEGKAITAIEAKKSGLVSEIYNPSQVDAELWPRIFSMTSLSTQSMLVTKSLMRKWDREMLHKVNYEEWEELRKRFVSEDFITAMLTFRHRRHKL